ncbi:hypothetical protein [Aestuariibaculum marinum]|uniref:Cation diffusion facilitator family transporter n=1 Tax=Aestuariibaculum marinum TaxID=2683592 RepID=A0A8J6U508_9FLAO|nr:hypothetical protein [Aestuariibaculum marinum]MBD0824457.1 hypothetical protein [Aestuariibaculum marinum]
MSIENLEIEIDQEELELIKEINETQNQMDNLDKKQLNSDLMNAVKDKAIETIAVVFGMSDVLEKRAHSNAFEADLEYKRFTEWKNTPEDQRSQEYKPKYIHTNEFNEVLETKKNIPVYNKEERKKLEGNEFVEAKLRHFNENAPKYVKDGYTGKEINRFETVRKEKADLEHTEPLSQIHHDPVLKKYLSLEERRKFANSEENTTITKAKINRSKGDIKTQDISEWADKNEERLGLNKDEINSKVKRSQEAKNKILFDKKIAYQAKDQIGIAGKNAVTSAGKAVVGKFLAITVAEVIDLYREPQELSFGEKAKLLVQRITAKAKDLFTTFKDSALGAFISTLVDALLNSIFKIAKNIFKFVKAGFNAVIKSIRILCDGKYSMKEKMNETLKVMGVAFAASIGFVIDELLDKALSAAFPFLIPFLPYMTPVISGLIVGIGSVLILQAFQKYQDNIAYTTLKVESAKLHQRQRDNAIVKSEISNHKVNKVVLTNIQIFQGVMPLIDANKKAIAEALSSIREIRSNIEASIENNILILNENDDLLNELEAL